MLEKKYYDGMQIHDVLCECLDDYDTILTILEKFASLPSAINADRKTENSSENPNNCEDCRNWNHNYGACTEIECNYEPNNFDKDINVRSKDEPKLSEIPTSKCHYEPKDEPQYDIDKGTIKCDNCSENGSYKCTKCDGEMYFKRLAVEDEPQTNADQHVQHVESVEPMQTEREDE